MWTLARLVMLEMVRRKDVYVLLILMGAGMGVLVSLNIFGLTGMVGYIQDLGLLFAWIIGWVLAIAVNARQLPDEERRGTIIPLLARPVTRLDVIAGKWLGCWLSVVAANACFYLLVIAVILARGGAVQAGLLVQGFVLHGVSLGVIGAMVLLLTTRMNADASTALGWVLVLTCYFVVPAFPSLMSLDSGWRADAMLALYHLLPHLDLFDARVLVAHALEPIGAGLFAGIVGYGLLLVVVFLGLAVLSYQGRRFARTGRL